MRITTTVDLHELDMLEQQGSTSQCRNVSRQERLKVAVHIQELRNRVVANWNSSAQIPSDGHTNLSYDQATNRITTAGFAYDAAGNEVRALIAGGASQRFQYDAANRLVNVKSDNSQITIASYTYGDSNERLIAEEGSQRTYYACDGMTEYTESGGSTTPQWSKTYIYLGARLLSTLTPNGSGGQFVQYHHPDRLGTRLVTNAQDTTYLEQQTLPFGTALNESPPAGGTTGSTNLRFTSYDRSLNTGLDYAINRHYDAQQGRFTQVDPIGMSSVSLESPQTLNLYAYCTNDPINHTDPSGLGFISFLKKIFKRAVNALIAAGVAFLVTFISTGSWQISLGVAIGTFVNTFLQGPPGYKPGFGTAPTFPVGVGRPALHQILQGTILSGLFPSPQSYLRFVNGFAGGSLDVDKTYSREFDCNRSANDLFRTIRRDFSKFASFAETIAEGAAVAAIKFDKGPITQGRIIGITTSVFSMVPVPTTLSFPSYGRHVSVTVTSASTTSFTFTTNPGHVFYPGTISFSVADVGQGRVRFTIRARGDLADTTSRTLFNLGAGSFENDVWKNLLDNAQRSCGSLK